MKRLLVAWLTFCVVALGTNPNPVRAATVFSNYNGVDCFCGFASATYAAGFVPVGSFELTGVSILLGNVNTQPGIVNLSLYDSVGGKPNAILADLGFVTADPRIGNDYGFNLATQSYTGPTLTLADGVQYFLTADLSDQAIWRGQGTTAQPVSFLDSSLWTTPASSSVQFQIFGTQVTATPEPATLLLLGAGLLGLAGIRRQG